MGALDHVTLDAGAVTCDICEGRLSWPEPRRLYLIIEAMSDHYAANHARDADRLAHIECRLHG